MVGIAVGQRGCTTSQPGPGLVGLLHQDVKPDRSLVELLHQDVKPNRSLVELLHQDVKPDGLIVNLTCILDSCPQLHVLAITATFLLGRLDRTIYVSVPDRRGPCSVDSLRRKARVCSST